MNFFSFQIRLFVCFLWIQPIHSTSFLSFFIAWFTHLELVSKPLVSGEPKRRIQSNTTMKKPKDFWISIKEWGEQKSVQVYIPGAGVHPKINSSDWHVEDDEKDEKDENKKHGAYIVINGNFIIYRDLCLIQPNHIQYIPINMLWMEEILHHLGCTKRCKQWDKLSIKWCRISSINSITTLAQPSHFENKIFWESCQVGLLRTWNGKKKESSRHPVCGGHFLRSMIRPFEQKGGICHLVSYLVSEFVSSPRGNIFGFRIGCCCSTLKFLKSFRGREASDVTKLSLFDVRFLRFWVPPAVMEESNKHQEV